VDADYAAIFWELIRKPFERPELVWGIVPLYFSWAMAELGSEKASFKTALQTGFNLLWAGAQWLWQHTRKQGVGDRLELSSLFVVNVIVTVITILLGAMALYCGVRRRFPKYWSFLGRTRFSSYLTITLFPIQANYFKWSWDRLVAVLLFAIPTWVAFGLMRRGLAAVRSAGNLR
jgi:ABC-type glycerol-3-phosphate transport system permease component